jgi:hypothetical protein
VSVRPNHVGAENASPYVVLCGGGAWLRSRYVEWVCVVLWAPRLRLPTVGSSPRPEQYCVDEEQLGGLGICAIVRILSEPDDLAPTHALVNQERLISELRLRLLPNRSAEHQVVEIGVTTDVVTLIERDGAKYPRALNEGTDFAVGARREPMVGIEQHAQDRVHLYAPPLSIAGPRVLPNGSTRPS